MPSAGRFDLIVFDMDGTLVDSRDGITEAIRSSLRERGHAVPPPGAIYPMIGLPLALIFERFLPEGIASGYVAELQTEYRVRYRRESLGLVREFPGVSRVLGDLKARGLRLAVATGRVHSMAIDVLKSAGLLDCFELVLGTDQVERPKPAPDLVLKALNRFEALPSRTLVVGDTVHDIEMGRSAGATTCAVTYGAQGPNELAPAAPDHTIDRFEELALILVP